MAYNLPKNWVRWVIFAVAMFFTGVIIAYLLMPSSPGNPANTKVRLTQVGGGQTQSSLDIVEDNESPLGVILAAVAVIMVVVGYGYYREKKRRKI